MPVLVAAQEERGFPAAAAQEEESLALSAAAQDEEPAAGGAAPEESVALAQDEEAPEEAPAEEPPARREPEPAPAAIAPAQLPLPTVSVSGPGGVAEGSVAEFAVSLFPASAQIVTVDYAAVDGSAAAGTDFAATSGTVVFMPGETAKAVSVPTIQDLVDEPDEVFMVVLSGAVNATVATGTATTTLSDDDVLPRISINDARAGEGASMTFTITASGGPASVEYLSVGGSALIGEDFDAVAGAVRFGPAGGSESFTVRTRDDRVEEPDEGFAIILTNAIGAMVVKGAGNGRIIDNDSSDVNIMDAAAGEGDAVVFTLVLNTPSFRQVTVRYTTVGGTAVSDIDFTSTSGELIFEEGEIVKTIPVPTMKDGIDEPNENFFLNLLSATNAQIRRNQATGTIIDTDPIPGVGIGGAGATGISDATVVEGGGAVFTVTLSNPSSQTVQVTFTTAPDTATEAVAATCGVAPAGTDYLDTSGVLNFAPGEIRKTITVPTCGDAVDEADETFFVRLSNPVNAFIVDDEAVGTIVDNDPPATITISDGNIVTDCGTGAPVTEGTAICFRVTLTGLSDQDVTVDFATEDGTAIAGEDYVPQGGTITFAPAASPTFDITVPTVSDDVGERTEIFFLVISNANNATITDRSGVGTITDDDLPLITVNDAQGVEGTGVLFTVRLSSPTDATVTVDFTTEPGTAAETCPLGVVVGVAVGCPDYTDTSGTLTFDPGDTTKVVTVATTQDTLDEADETFFLVLSGGNAFAKIADNVGIGTIIDADVPKLSISDASAPEGSALVFTVTLAREVGHTVTVAFFYTNGTALAGTDYTAAAGSPLTFEPGETAKTIVVPTIDDQVSEGNEIFTVTLSAPTGATLLDFIGLGTITDNDPPPTVSVNDITVPEGAPAVFTVSLSGPSSTATTVSYRLDLTTTGTATATGGATCSGFPVDFDNDPGTAGNLGSVTVPAGATSAPLPVPTCQDTVDEPDETFFVNLTAVTGTATIGDGLGKGTIVDDDPLPLIFINDARVAEFDTITFTLTLSNSSASTVTVQYTVVDGTATGGPPTCTGTEDYTTTGTPAGTLADPVSFVSGTNTATITFPTCDDARDEPNETFSVKLHTAVNGTIQRDIATGTIVDDDDAPTLNVCLDSSELEATSPRTCTVTLSPASDQTVTVNFTTSNATATAGTDYKATSGILRFLPGITSLPIDVAVTNDTLDEPNEFFHIVLSNPSGAVIGDGSAQLTITDDDDPPGLVLTGDTTANDGDGATVTYTVTMSPASGKTVTVDWTAGGGTASPGVDFAPISGSLTFAPGDTVRTFAIQVSVVSDNDETFTVRILNAVNATITTASVAVEI